MTTFLSCPPIVSGFATPGNQTHFHPSVASTIARNDGPGLQDFYGIHQVVRSGKALSRLENVARSNGIAVGTLSALPISIDRVAQWAKTVESRGFILVPISVAAARSKSS